MTRQSARSFNDTNVKKLLASVAEVAKAGHRIVLDKDGGFIENIHTSERMKMRVEKNVYVYNEQMEDEKAVTVTLDSGADCNVWAEGLFAGSSVLKPSKKGFNMFGVSVLLHVWCK